MRSKVLMALLVAGVTAFGFGCGRGGDPAGDACHDCFVLIANRKGIEAFQKYSWSKEFNLVAMKSWSQTFGGHMPSGVTESKYFDSEGKECSPSEAVKATVRFKSYMGGAMTKGNMCIWTMPCEKEKDAQGNMVWKIHFPQCKM